MDNDLVSALRDNVAQKQALIDKLVAENAQLHEIFRKLKLEEGKSHDEKGI